jgi:hypothetical protein
MVASFKDSVAMSKVEMEIPWTFGNVQGLLADGFLPILRLI